MIRTDEKFARAAGFLGFAMATAFLVFQFTTRWEWSILMDDIMHRKDYSVAAAPSALGRFTKDIRDYKLSGRFHPVKCIINMVDYRYLAASPWIPHAFHAALLMAALAAGAWWLTKGKSLGNHRVQFAALVVGLGLLQRPLLDIAGMCSIAEVGAALFFIFGLCLFPQNPVGYRLLFLLCALSKEPGVTVFLGSGFIHLKNLVLFRDRKVSRLLSAALDLGVFFGLALTMKHIQEGGTYLRGYHILDPENAKRFLFGMAKAGFGMAPVLLVLAVKSFRGEIPWREWIRSADVEALSLVYALAYLALVTPRGVAGYLLVPPAAGFWIAGSGLLMGGISREWDFSKGLRAGFLGLFVLCGAISMTRYIRMVRGINEGTVAFHLARMSETPRMVISNAMEASMTSSYLAEKEGVPVKFMSIESGAVWEPKTLLAGFTGDVVLIEQTQYFGRFPPDFLKIYEDYLGGWTQVMDHGVVRLYYGKKRGPQTP